MPLILPARTLDSSYEIDNSFAWRTSNSGVLSKTYSGTGTGAARKFTVSAWIKTNGGDAYLFAAQADSNNRTVMALFSTVAAGGIAFENKISGTSSYTVSKGTCRDPAAWYHAVYAIDTTQGTDSNRVKIYLNGVQQTDLRTGTGNAYPAQDVVTNFFHSSNATFMGSRSGGNFFDGYMAEVNIVDGLQLAASNFGETNDNGVWIPKSPDVSEYGTNGGYYQFKETGTGTDSSGMGADTSGKGNHFATSNISAINIVTDTPSNNFCTLNPLANALTNPITVSEGNLKAVGDSSSWEMISSTMGASKGKWYWEAKLTALTSAAHIGITDDFDIASGGLESYFGHQGSGIAFGKGQDASIYYTGIADATYGTTHAAGDIISVALDLDNNFIYFAKNGTYQDYSSATGNPTSGSSGTGGFPITANTLYIPAVASNQSTWEVNYGNPTFAISSGNSDGAGFGNFEYAVPSGYFSWCTKNLAEYG